MLLVITLGWEIWKDCVDESLLIPRAWALLSLESRHKDELRYHQPRSQAVGSDSGRALRGDAGTGQPVETNVKEAERHLGSESLRPRGNRFLVSHEVSCMIVSNPRVQWGQESATWSEVETDGLELRDTLTNSGVRR